MLGSIATLLAPSFLMVSMALMLLWMGFGFFEVGTNALATTAFTAKSAIFMNLMHFFYGLGAVFGPKSAGILSNTFHFSFKGIYAIALIPLIIVATVVLLSKVEPAFEEKEEQPTLTIKGALKSTYVWLIAATLGFMEVVEFGAANWGVFYLRDVLNMDPLTLGATFVSTFYIGFTLSRLFSGFIIDKIGYAKSIVISLMILFVLYLIGFSLGNTGIWVLALTGVFVAILWPTIMCFAMTIFKKDAAIATSVVIVLSGTINGIMQFATGVINEHIGEMWGYRLSTVYVLIPLALMIYMKGRVEKNNNGLNI
jgi:fucose permease